MAVFSKQQHGEEEGLLEGEQYQGRRQSQKSRKWIALTAMSVLGLFALAMYSVPGIQCNTPSHTTQSDLSVTSTLDDKSKRSSRHGNNNKDACNTVENGYQCNSELTHKWGQYSPYFSVADESPVSDEAVPKGCEITFAQVISRHGARFPSANKSKAYAKLLNAIHANATAYNGKTKFLSSYEYTMGSDDLVPFGENQLLNSGIKFYQRYQALAKKAVPFIRSAESERVIASGEKFIEGFKQAKLQDKKADHEQPAPKISVLISEEVGANNTLNHNTCPKFEDNVLGDEVEDKYTAVFVPPIKARLEADLPGVKFTDVDVVSMMDLCPFETVSLTEDASELSPFCDLFTQAEWNQYDYLQSVSKYYGYGAGNPLGPTQGVGFVNELIARLTKTPVNDHTSTNSTLDAPGASTFPLNYNMYADFSHDNGMLPIYFAMGLYNGTAPLPIDHLQTPKGADGYSSAKTVSFGARAYIEMMQCRKEPEPLVRVLVNDRVVPLHGCKADKLGRCRRSDFVKGLSYARAGGDWTQCYE
ncbi:Histidine phosphatase superfamily clade-2 [Penicillium robsamsonii]|uniref:Histidine phosphatase superfamily clade-2 n=1 Tax=Penicillium robsamsonii TaxID=1792511 RepID=UPI0025481049|nr:Histidine phosphatase superfamily clade-2 [Penicillium robsamsonii]KAJ5824132.1 Histidine phosphatase superfamily clade-2 [Penicillium robsamsonii]